ncbi:hypothetical protein FRC18_000173 [Serendipita sp. 400]|nr:hypothetical protein FRC18_000173 [Serendipita sp. 400]
MHNQEVVTDIALGTNQLEAGKRQSEKGRDVDLNAYAFSCLIDRLTRRSSTIENLGSLEDSLPIVCFVEGAGGASGVERGKTYFFQKL